MTCLLGVACVVLYRTNNNNDNNNSNNNNNKKKNFKKCYLSNRVYKVLYVVKTTTGITDGAVESVDKLFI